MKRLRGPTLGALLVIVLCFGAWRSAWAMGQRHDQADRHAPVVAPDTFASPSPCSATFHEQEIPDDGSWLQVCLLDPSAPDQSTITEVHVKYLLDHPDPNQLEIQLTRADTSISQTLWNRGNTIKGAKLGEAGSLDAFNGTPSQGEWHLLVRDVVPGQKGLLKVISIRADYAPVGPLPRMLSGTPGRPTSFHIPSGVTKSSTPDTDGKKSAETSNAASLQVSGWQDVKSETFEGVFPNAGWTLIDANPNDGKEYLWDDDDFRHHNGGWAAWPANGGVDGLDPAASSTYPPNMASWMIYGPFDLSDAKTAETAFWLWRQIQVSYDYVFFGISSDGSNFNGYKWDGTADWEQERLSLNDYLGKSTVWVAWLFVSDGSVQYEGPWVDDILIRKYVPGQVTAQGSFFYADRNNNTVLARFTKVYLYDQDPGGTDDLLATTTTNANGFFQFPARTNWDDDDTDPDPNNRRLDLYVVWETDYNDSATARHRVTNVSGQAYTWPSFTSSNAPDATVDFSSVLPVGRPNLEAMWIFQDLRRAWEYVRNNTNPQTDPGSVTARWETGRNDLTPCSGSCFYAGPGGPYIFIAQRSSLSADAVVHETGHNYMYNATGWWLWWDVGCYSHDLFTQEDVNCAWSEGWADFFALPVNSTLNPNDACFDYQIGPCQGILDQDYFNLETHSRNDNQAQFPFGDIVEGRVAGALYDLWDSTNEPIFDSATFGFDPIADMVFQAPHEDTFRKFWDSCKTSGQNKHQAVRAIYQNTIDYDTAPRFDPPLPDRVALQNLTMPHVIDLWDYSTDDESTDAELGWQIVNVTDARCGISLDSHFVNFAPQQGWLGSCDVTISVSDSIKANTDTFRVTVVPVRGRSFLPVILK
jgi:hypothetical protein